MGCPPEICQGMTEPHEGLLFGSHLFLFYRDTKLEPVTEKLLVFDNTCGGGGGLLT
jgi:hypothetical protein